jgi:hypothetical protein
MNISLHDLEIGYTYTEFGVKYKFVDGSKNVPEIRGFPIIEIPTTMITSVCIIN